MATLPEGCNDPVQIYVRAWLVSLLPEKDLKRLMKAPTRNTAGGRTTARDDHPVSLVVPRRATVQFPGGKELFVQKGAKLTIWRSPDAKHGLVVATLFGDDVQTNIMGDFEIVTKQHKRRTGMRSPRPTPARMMGYKIG